MAAGKAACSSDILEQDNGLHGPHNRVSSLLAWMGSASVDVEELELLSKARRRQLQNGRLTEHEWMAKSRDSMDHEIVLQAALAGRSQILSCTSLPFTLVFFSLFLGFSQNYYKVHSIFLNEAPFHKLAVTARSIKSLDQVYDWMESEMIPFIWKEKKNGTVTNHFRDTVGGVLLKTSRASRRLCQDRVADHIQCFSESNPTKEEAAAFPSSNLQGQRRLRYARSEILSGLHTWLSPLFPTRATSTAASDNFTFSSGIEAMQSLTVLHRFQLLRPITLTFSFQFVTHNVALDPRELVTFCEITFYQHRGGTVMVYHRVQTVVLYPFRSRRVLAAGCLWTACLVFYSSILLYRLVRILRGERKRLLTRWDLMEWLIMLFGWAAIAAVAWERVSTKSLRNMLHDFYLQKKK